MRTRERKVTASMPACIIKYWSHPSGTYLRADTYPQSYLASQSTITDEAKNPLGFNACDHLIVENDCPNLGRAPRAYHPITGKQEEIAPVPSHSHTGLWPAQLPTLDWSSALAELERNARGDMNTNVNLVVNAAEVFELKSLAKGICQSFNALTRKWRIKDPRVRRFLKNRKRKGRRASGPTLQEIADSHLAYSFGVAPLMQDIGAFLEVNQKIRDRRAELRARSLIPTRINARISNELDSETSLTVSSNPNDWPSVGKKFEAWTKAEGVVSAISFAFYNLDNPSTRWKMVAQSLGLTSPLISTWNLIPFSFVADWFLPIGKAIKKVERSAWDLVDEAAVTTAYTLTDYHYSIKYTGVTLLEARTLTSPVPSWVGIRLTTQAQRWSRYIRNTGMPAIAQWWPDSSSEWSVTRTALATSLSIQRLRSTPKPGPKKWPSLGQIYKKASHVRR